MENKIHTDEELIQLRLETKDNFFLEQLIKRYTPLIKSLLTVYKIPKQDYEDSYQELLLIFIKLVNKYKPGEVNFKGYIKDRLKKRYYNYIRKNY